MNIYAHEYSQATQTLVRPDVIVYIELYPPDIVYIEQFAYKWEYNGHTRHEVDVWKGNIASIGIPAVNIKWMPCTDCTCRRFTAMFS